MDLFEIIYVEGGVPSEIVDRRGMRQVSDTAAIEKALDEIINDNPNTAIKTKDNPALFDVFIEKLEQVNPMQVQVVQDHLHLDLEDDDDIIDEAEDTLTILNNYVDNLEIKNEKVDLQSLLRALYDEALQVS